VADVKMCRDFLSRRLMMMWAENVKNIENEQFLHTVSLHVFFLLKVLEDNSDRTVIVN